MSYKDKKRVMFPLDEESLEKLDAISDRERRSRANMLEQIVENFIEDNYMDKLNNWDDSKSWMTDPNLGIHYFSKNCSSDEIDDVIQSETIKDCKIVTKDQLVHKIGHSNLDNLIWII